MASVLVALVASRQQLVCGDPADRSPAGADAVDGLCDLRPAAVGLRHQPSDGAAVAGYDDGLATLNLVKQLGEMGLSLGRRYFTHGVGPNWSIRLVKNLISLELNVNRSHSGGGVGGKR
jgi:hypothetical protein